MIDMDLRENLTTGEIMRVNSNQFANHFANAYLEWARPWQQDALRSGWGDMSPLLCMIYAHECLANAIGYTSRLVGEGHLNT